MATHPGILACRIPWTEELSRLWSIGLQRVRHDWSNLTYTHIKHIDHSHYCVHGKANRSHKCRLDTHGFKEGAILSATLPELEFSHPWPPTCFTLAAAAAKSFQSCLTLCSPMDGSPLGSSVSGILQAGTLEWVAISFSNAWKWKVKVKLLSRARLLATPWTAAYQAHLSMGFSRQKYWTGLPLPSPKWGA